jgi:hypothetical protein
MGVGLTNLPYSCADVLKSGSLNFLEPSGPVKACQGLSRPVKACNGIALPLPFTILREELE